MPSRWSTGAAFASPSAIVLGRTPIAMLVVGGLLDFAGGALAEPVMSLLFAASVVAWFLAARIFGARAALLTAVKNVYLDTSFQSELLYPSQLKPVLKQLLTLYPDKLMYGSDAFPFNDALGAEESFWIAPHTTRTALAGALAELVSEHAISEDKAMELARLYLHDNAAKLYGGAK